MTKAGLRRILTVAMGLLLLSSSACSSSGSSARPDTADKVVPVEDWLLDVCPAVARARAAIPDALASIDDSASIDDEEGRSALRAALADNLVAAAEELRLADRDLADAGHPDVGTGSALASGLREGVTQQAESSQNAADGIRRIAVDDRAVFEEQLVAAATAVTGVPQLLADTSRDLLRDPEIGTAAAELEECVALG